MPTIRVLVARADLLEIPKLVANEYNRLRKKPEAILVRNDGFSQLLYHVPNPLIKQVENAVQDATIPTVVTDTYDQILATTGFSGKVRFRPIGLETTYARMKLEGSQEWCTIFYFESIK